MFWNVFMIHCLSVSNRFAYLGRDIKGSFSSSLLYPRKKLTSVLTKTLSSQLHDIH